MRDEDVPLFAATDDVLPDAVRVVVPDREDLEDAVLLLALPALAIEDLPDVFAELVLYTPVLLPERLFAKAELNPSLNPH